MLTRTYANHMHHLAALRKLRMSLAGYHPTLPDDDDTEAQFQADIEEALDWVWDHAEGLARVVEFAAQKDGSGPVPEGWYGTLPGNGTILYRKEFVPIYGPGPSIETMREMTIATSHSGYDAYKWRFIDEKGWRKDWAPMTESQLRVVASMEWANRKWDEAAAIWAEVEWDVVLEDADPCMCFSIECPEPYEHPVHAASQHALGKSITMCPHDCPADLHGSAHYIPNKERTT